MKKIGKKIRHFKPRDTVALRTITVHTAPGNRQRALLRFGSLTIPAAIGRSGLTARKREGDGATPRATMRILGGFARFDRLRGGLRSRLALTRTAKNMLWCDAPGTANYNRPVLAPFKPSHEELIRSDEVYDIVLVLDWNVTRRAQGCGSAIFFHLIRPGYQPTAGCVAIALRDMLRLLPHIDSNTRLKIVG